MKRFFLFPLRQFGLAISLCFSTLPVWEQPVWAQDELPAAPLNSLPLPQQGADENPDDATAIELVLSRFAAAISARDANALRIVGLEAPEKYARLTARLNSVGVGVQGNRALARYRFQISGLTSGNNAATVAKSGVHDVALGRGAGGWNLSGARWEVLDPIGDALQVLGATAQDEWDALASPGTPAAREDVVLHLIVERRGGRWIALRRSRWSGRVFSLSALARRESTQKGVGPWLEDQLSRRVRAADAKNGGTLHLLMQNGARGWVGLDGVWENRLSDARPSEQNRSAPLEVSVADRSGVLAQRAQQNGDGYGDGEAHRDFARALEANGVFGEAADEYEKAIWLRPDAVSENRVKAARARRGLDPQTRAARQLQEEARVGLVSDHPRFVIDALKIEQRARPTPLRSLRLGLEYSKLGDDVLAAQYLNDARTMMRQGAWQRLSPDDVAWIDVLAEHLEQRRQLAPIKPPNLLRSALFTVRCRLDESSVLPTLAALEAAQHTVYGDFQIPMGATEVVLWRTQREFQDYTTRFSSQGGSEFVAALTLTKLISTEAGPLVLGEEVNVFVDERLSESTFGTVAHEYGHVAVRQLSRGRSVPVWFNEGIATVVEGGYDGYRERVANARRANRLLSMSALREWNVDGERAFLAYSQANSMIDYIVATAGPNALLEILRQIGRDVAPEAAFQKVLGVSTNQLWTRWAQQGGIEG